MMQRLTFRALGSWISATVRAQPCRARDALAAVPRWFSVWEQTFSNHRTDSEISNLNRHSGKWFDVSDALWSGLQAARQAAGEVERMLNHRAVPHAALSGRDWRAIEFAADRRAVRTPSGLQLDIGGIARGWAADTAARWLAKIGPACVDAGGHIAVRGVSGGDAIPVRVADPLDPLHALDVLLVSDGSIATSGRAWPRDLMARRGPCNAAGSARPAGGAPRMLAATVMAPSAVQAAATARAALVLGSAASCTWIESQPDLAAMLVMDGGEIARTHAWLASCRSNQPWSARTTLP